MQTLGFIAPGQLAWREVPKPTLQGPEEAIVRPRYMGRCDLDRLYLIGRLPLASGSPIGHEIIGEIVELGDAAAGSFRPGDLVIVPSQISCGACAPCERGDTGRCASVPLGASYGMGRAGDFGGGVADFVRVPYARAMLVPVPRAAASPSLLGLADMATDAWRAVGPQLARRPGGRVLVVAGDGPVPVIALYAAGLAVCLGAERVDLVAYDPALRAAAARFGAHAAESLDALPAGPYEVLVDAAGDADLLVRTLDRAGPAALMTSVAPATSPASLSLMPIYYKGLEWRIGRPDCRAGHGPALGAWASLGFRPELAGPKVWPYEEAIEAWLDRSLYTAVERRDPTG